MSENITEIKEAIEQKNVPKEQSQQVANQVDMINSVTNSWNKRMERLLNSNYSVSDINAAFGNIVVENPDLRNRVLKNLKTIPYLPERTDIEKALKAPYSNEKLLRGIGSSLFNTCFPLYKLLRFYDGVLTFKYKVEPKNIKSEYMTTNRFKQEQKFVNEWVKKLNPEYQGRRIVQEVMQTGKRAYYLVEDYDTKAKEKTIEEVKTEDTSGNKKVKFEEKKDIVFGFDGANRKIKSVFLRDLPDDYVKIVGKSTDSYYTIAFDFSYFMTMGADVNDYPKIFKEYLDKITGAKKEVKKKITIDTDKLTDIDINKFGYEKVSGVTRFYCWVNMPSDVCQVFSADESTPLQAPNFMGLYLMSADLEAYNLLQQQLTGVPLYSMVVGQIPINDADKKNPLLLDTATVDHFTGMINSFMPNGTTFVMTPTKDNKVVTFNEQPNATKIYNAALQGVISTAGMAGLLSTTDKPSMSQIKTSQLSEKRFVDVFYQQFDNFVNRQLEKLTDQGYLRYDWEFRCFGDIYTEKERIETLSKGLAQGITPLIIEYLAYFNLTLEDAVTNADWVKASGLYDKLLPLVSSYQQGANSDAGKPEKDDSDVDNDDTAKSKDAGSNKGENRTVVNSVSNSILLQEILQKIEKMSEEMQELEGRGE